MLYLHGIGHFHPGNVLDNDFIESLDIGADAQWILDRVGIKERRTVLPLDYIRSTRNRDRRAAQEASEYTNAQTAEQAARMAVARAVLKTSDLGMVISGGCSPQFLIPSDACMTAAALNLDVPAFDLHSACSSFALQIHFLNSMRPEALPDYVLIINAENMTGTVDYSDRSTAVLWGDGAMAAVVSASIPSNIRVQLTSYDSAPSGWDKITLPTAGYFRQDGPAIQAFAVRRMTEIAQALQKHSKCGGAGPFFVGHQANLRMLRSVCERLHLPPERHFYNLDRFGNTGSAGAPSVISEHWNDLGPSDEIMIAVVGAGLAWGGVLLQFA